MLLIITAVWRSADHLKRSMFALSGIFEKKLPFRSNPMMTGGEVCAIIPDRINDNKKISPEGLTDTGSYFTSTDIVSYIIHNATVTINGEKVWNLDLEFNELNVSGDNPNRFGLIKGIIYIDIDNAGGSSLSYYTDDKIIFDKEFRWDYFIEFDYLHKNGKIFSFSTKNFYAVPVEFKEINQTIRLGLPVIEELNKNMNKIRTGKHIAMAGLYTPFEKDNFIEINRLKYYNEKAKDPENKTRYFDFICSGISQTENKIMIAPAAVSDYSSGMAVEGLDQIENSLKSLSEANSQSLYGMIKEVELQNAYDLYNNKNYKAAEEIFAGYKQSSSAANTYLGLIRANSAKTQSNSGSKIDFVNDAYDYFDKAESLAKDNNDLYVLLLNRINVSRSVPDEIFHKSGLLKKDLLKFLTIENLTEKERSEIYIKLIELLKNKDSLRELRFLVERIKKEMDLI